MPEPPTIERFSLSIDRPAVPIAARSGDEIVLRGALTSRHDGSIIDAATTTWPAGAPGGASVDARGLVDFEKGGLHVTSRDPVTHEVHAVVTGEPAVYCSTAGVASPCLPIRLLALGNSRLLTAAEWRASLMGTVTVEVPVAPAPTPASTAAAQARGYAPALLATLGLGLALLLGFAAVRAWRRRAESPRARLIALARRVRARAASADPLVAAPLTPALDDALARLAAGRVDADSDEGKRVGDLLMRVDAALQRTAAQARAADERREADELVLQVEAALEAADDTLAADARRAVR